MSTAARKPRRAKSVAKVEPQQAAPQPGRDQQGKFTKGNRGGPGNPMARRCAKLRSLLVQSATDEIITEIAHQLIELCRAGNVQAMKLYLSYVCNKPTPPVCDPDQLHHHEHKCWETDALDFLHLKPLMEAPNMDLLMEATRIYRDHVTEQANRSMCGMATASEKEIKQYQKRSLEMTSAEAMEAMRQMGKAPEWDPKDLHIQDLAPNPDEPRGSSPGHEVTPEPVVSPSTNGRIGHAPKSPTQDEARGLATGPKDPRGRFVPPSTNGHTGHGAKSPTNKPRDSQNGQSTSRKSLAWLPPELRNERLRLQKTGKRGRK